MAHGKSRVQALGAALRRGLARNQGKRFEVTESNKENASGGTRRRGRLRCVGRTVLGLVLALVLLNFAIGLGKFLWFATTCPYEIEYGEGILLQNALNIAHGREVYNDYRHYPFVVATYPPVYPLLCAVGARLFGISFTFGRLLSVLCTIGVAALIWAMLRRTGGSRFAAGFGATLFLAAPAVCRWGVVMRVDMVAVAFGVAGLYCVMRGGRWLTAAVVLLFLAVYTRQSQVAPLAAGVLYLWWTRRRREAALVAASFGAAVLVVFLALELASHGWFYRHVIVANMNYWEIQRLVEIWTWTFPTWRFPFLLGLLGVGFTLIGPGVSGKEPYTDPQPRPDRLLMLYFGFGMLLSLTAGKVGSYVNYMLEPLAAASLMAGVAYMRLAQLFRSPRWKPAWVAAWLLMVGPPAWVLGHPNRAPYEPYAFSPYAIMQAGNKLVPLLRNTKGDVLSEDTGLLLITGHQILLDPHKMSSMSRDGTWDPRPLLRDISRRRFALIITTWNPGRDAPDRWGCYGWYRWTLSMGLAIKRNYYLRKHVGGLYALAPADARHPSFATVTARFMAKHRLKK